MASLKGMSGRLSSRDASEDAADRHTEPGQVATPEDVPRHDLAGGEEARHYLVVLTQDFGAVGDADAVVGEGDAGLERVGVEGRFVDATGPVAFRHLEAFGAAVVKLAQV